jgi:hypothetical protein
MAFKVIAGKAETPLAIKNAIALLNSNGYNIDEVPTDKVVIELHGIDRELGYFVGKFMTAGTWAQAEKGIQITWLDLLLLDNVAFAIAEANKDRQLRHDITSKYFGTASPTTDLYRNLAGFRTAFAGLDTRGDYSIRINR